MRRLVPLLALAGCFGQKDTLGLPCDFPSQCDAGQDCVQGICRESPQTSATTSGGSADTDATASSEPPGDLPPCEPFSQEVAPLPSRIVLVLDLSIAAAVDWDHDGNAGTPELPKRQSLVDALSAQLPMLDATVELGLALSPSKDATAIPTADACHVDPAPIVSVAPQNSGAVLGALPVGDPVGAAPIAPTMAAALTELAQTPGPEPRGVVLVLTGAANCGDGAEGDGLFEAYAAELHAVLSAGFVEAGIPTAVVGVGLPDEPYPMQIDGFPDAVNPNAEAQLLAEDGGLPRPGADKYYRAQDGINLGPSIRDAFFAARMCVLPLPAELFGVGDFDVLVGDVPLDEVAECGSAPGFVVEGEVVEICGSACALLKADEGATATMRVECG